ncbi:alkyl hydroperoxide reductase/ Thiol specific antioxidant/ Mal allergen [[Leptolyngbya] sp. PCC 7376]|uniref:peroxiredoxin n=1 Tax=[Leptolyngbya] sp. PCC 7376 TaxID=111781 RepID=UPI00029EE71F|nr:peroxiredoxin [[Leptolyngbya] sp. PCC 7376]AFY38483.1 alkyl hydroperoxide reductase/ Thiol specific antioxidant/ Mal allergen [[Leptolyngbya] sp. PCC 7376]
MFKVLRPLLMSLCLAILLWFPANDALALGGKQPDLNAPAPEFTLLGNNGDGDIDEFSLSDYLGQWVVLYFYPQDFTPGCTLEAQRFQQDLPKYNERDVQILGVSVDDVDSHEQFCDAEGLKFPLLADAKGEVSKSYGSYLTGYSLRHTYLIDPKGLLQKIYLGVNPAIHSQEVLADLDSLTANS